MTYFVNQYLSNLVKATATDKTTRRDETLDILSTPSNCKFNANFLIKMLCKIKP